MKVLVLDDDPSFLETVREMLSTNKHSVDCSDNAKEAVKIFESGDYDYVLVDYKMPENDGIWFMANVTLPRKTKALLMTAYVNRDVINKMFSLGASGYLIKPFNEEDLLRHIAFFSTNKT
jgi:CheY-like chemotaxis protein